MTQYNLRNPAVKRLMKEAEELLHPTDEYHAQPIDDNLFEWHFTIRGPPNSDFEGGVYHGRITLPPDYPMKPPSIILLTPNGRFETNKKICLSISGHHPESWQPSWSIRTALLAIIGFMPTHGNGALGSLDYTPQERQQLALRSQAWKCPECGGCIKDIFDKKSSETQEEQNDTSETQDDTSETQEEQNDTSEFLDEELRNALRELLVIERVAESLPPRYSLDQLSSEKTDSELIPSKEDETSVVHRRKGSEVPEVTDEVQPTTPRQNDNNFLYSAFIFVIVTIFIFLCVRRILYM